MRSTVPGYYETSQLPMPNSYMNLYTINRTSAPVLPYIYVCLKDFMCLTVTVPAYLCTVILYEDCDVVPKSGGPIFLDLEPFTNSNHSPCLQPRCLIIRVATEKLKLVHAVLLYKCRQKIH